MVISCHLKRHKLMEVYLEMLGLPLEYKESKLRKEIIAHMKDFILELGKDFLFIDDEHRVTV